jgi:hypothetical protein
MTDQVNNENLEQQFEDSTKASENIQEMDIPQNQKTEKINVPEEVAYSLKLYQFDKEITTAEMKVAELKQQKAAYMFQRNLDIIVKQNKEQLLKAQIEEETKKRLIK